MVHMPACGGTSGAQRLACAGAAEPRLPAILSLADTRQPCRHTGRHWRHGGGRGWPRQVPRLARVGRPRAPARGPAPRLPSALVTAAAAVISVPRAEPP